VDRDAAEVSVLADLVLLVAELGDAEAADRRRRARVVLRFGQGGRRDELRARADDGAGKLRGLHAAGVAGGVVVLLAVDIGGDRRPPVVAGVGVRLGDLHVAVGVELADRPVVGGGNRVLRIDLALRVRIGHVDSARGGDVAHPRHVLAVGRQVERQFRLGGEAGHHGVRVDHDPPVRPATRGDLVEEDLGGDPEAAVHGALLNTCGYVPSAAAVTQLAAAHPGGS
jgi:hypothetical protein